MITKLDILVIFSDVDISSHSGLRGEQGINLEVCMASLMSKRSLPTLDDGIIHNNNLPGSTRYTPPFPSIEFSTFNFQRIFNKNCIGLRFLRLFL